MARLRKGCSYHRLQRANTRKSKFRKKSFIKAQPALRIVRFDMGTPIKKFQYKLQLRSERDIHIRDNALESARQTSNRLLEKTMGNSAYYMKIRVYPHNILRENPVAQGAGADRFSTGMQRAFGKPHGNAVRTRKDQIIMEVNVDKQGLPTAKSALVRASQKLPCSCKIEILENKN